MSKGTVRIITATAMIALLLASWYSLINNSGKLTRQYEAYVNNAREKAKVQINVEAINYYNQALQMKDTIELRDEIAQFYYDAKQDSAYIEWCLEMMDKYPYEKQGYERAIRYYCDNRDYYTCYDMIRMSEKREIKSDVIENIKLQTKNLYEISSAKYAETGAYTVGYCPVMKNDGYWGYVNAYGSAAVSFMYEKCAVFTSSGLAPVYSQRGRWELIDIGGNVRHADTEGKNITDVKPIYSDLMAVQYDGKYHYCDIDFKEKFGAYDEAGAMNCGVAAVRDGSTWFVINDKGSRVGDNTFDEIVLDDRTVAFRNNVAFAKNNGKYILIDTKGNQIGTNSWDDVIAFNSDEPAAVKSGNKWGFVNSKGELVVQPTYENARSFSNGFAAVCDLGKWGYIDSTAYEISIECKFEDAGDFSQKGSVFIKDDGMWSLLKIYRLR